METLDPYPLERFVAAQSGTFDKALRELATGRKRSHWMWFIFPQAEGLGSSAMARRYAIGSKAEAKAYLAHPELGPRLRACADALLGVHGRSARQIMGYPDYLKLQSSMTLFAATDSHPNSPFDAVLIKYYDGLRDENTLRFLQNER